MQVILNLLNIQCFPDWNWSIFYFLQPPVFDLVDKCRKQFICGSHLLNIFLLRQHCYTENDLHNSVCLAPKGSNTNSRSHISNLFNLDNIPGLYVFIIQDRYPGPDVDMVVCPGVIYRQQPLSRILFCFSQSVQLYQPDPPPTISPEVSKCQVWKSWQLFGNILLWTPIWENWHNSRKWRSVRKNLF